MKTSLMLTALTATGFVVYACVADDKTPKKPTVRVAVPSRTADEKLLRQSAVDFAAAYDARDAKKIAAQFAAQAEMVDEQGRSIQGREAIEKAFAAQFAQPSPYKMAVEIDSLRFLSEN